MTHRMVSLRIRLAQTSLPDTKFRGKISIVISTVTSAVLAMMWIAYPLLYCFQFSDKFIDPQMVLSGLIQAIILIIDLILVHASHRADNSDVH